MRTILTVHEVIAQLGGTAEVAKLTGKSQTAVCNWRIRRVFPPATYPVMTDALRQRELVAASGLWRVIEPVAAVA